MDSLKFQHHLKLKIEIDLTRKNILDLLEMAFGDHPKWSIARSCILRNFGGNGLEGFTDRWLKQLDESGGYNE